MLTSLPKVFIGKYLQNQKQSHKLLPRHTVAFHTTYLVSKILEGNQNDPDFSTTLYQETSNTEKGLLEFSGTLQCGVKCNSRNFVYLIRASTNLGSFHYGHQLHSYAAKSGFSLNVFVSTALIGFYLKFELLSYAHKLFVEIPHPNVVSWNALITGYVHVGQFRKALSLFLELERSNLCAADSFSFTTALTACGQLGLLQLGRSIHSKLLKLGHDLNVVVSNCLIDVYGKSGYADLSTRVFNEMVYKDIISWNSIVAANARNQKLEEAFIFFNQMPVQDTISYNEIINGIAHFGIIEEAIEFLFKMQNPNTSSWNSILTGYVNRNRAREALNFLVIMHSKGVQMDQFTFSSILSGIADASALTWGVLIHCCIVKYGFNEAVVVGSALIGMYSKCGQVNSAEYIFEALPRKNLVTWNTMILGFARDGNSTKVIDLFEEMKMTRNLKPDEFTFLSVLSACSHSQMPLDIATKYFEAMVKDYGIYPTAEHCSSMIRLMGEKGEVRRAEKMIYDLGFASCGTVWRALLCACGACGDAKVAEVAAKKLVALEDNDEFVYVLMSNIYALNGKWGDAGFVRKLMKERKVNKEAGRSWIELEDMINASPGVQ